MERKFYCCFLIVLCLINCLTGSACTIFIANDGQHIWIGNNEDESPDLSYRLWYYPQHKKSYGYMIWTELSEDKELNKIMYRNPQGGMNEHGLFMDYTAIDEIAAIRDPNKLDRSEEVVTDVLRQCKTVQEAVDYIMQFNLVRLTGAQLFIGDADGDYAIIHANYCIRKTSRNFALTNYAVNNNHYEFCWRRDMAIEYLAQERVFHLKDVAFLLEKTAQKKPGDIISNYSMATDLRARQIHLYYKGDFSRTVTISLKKELNRGVHQQDMARYFP
ncbi:carcinine hydrolase/isopenicillin-N N-acyltransferase family protein [Sphingobacterium sp. HMA12]|uniref:carcinine hydrolase/isopenicillin-N N-acyltransferase family protein n=1 Tax=Sphingobacterium sp. HMA12 TaxID=2050894 RepID=UPI0013155A82|nr:carcinine hydrolase/isopenicillin-N N-acyltransferase family protein [Sphingobacterium sp. HMA12]